MEHELNLFLHTLIIGIVVGVYLFIIAHKMKIPAIVLLLVGGIAIGPEGFKWIDPDNIERELNAIISFAVAIILFEGGLSLHPKGYNNSKKVIQKILSTGVLITWLGTSAIVYFLFDYSLSFCLLTGSLIIVTGPTVINPILKRIKVKEKIHHILHYEGVLSDPIGVFIALLCYELVLSLNEPDINSIIPLMTFYKRVLIGGIVGVAGGFLMTTIIKKFIVNEEFINIFVLASVLAMFGLCDYFVPETGLLAVTIAGFIIGWRNPPFLKKIKQFQTELTDIAIGLLFILLAAKLEFETFKSLGMMGLVLILSVIFIVRPLNIFASTFRQDVSFKEKILLSWIAPRGIVAASMASVVAIKMNEKNIDGGNFIEAFVFSIIGITVILQGFSAGLVAKWLDLLRPPRRDWLIITANRFSQEIGKFIQNNGFKVVMLDSNPNNIEAAQKHGLQAIHADAFNVDLFEWDELMNVGNILILTDNKSLNTSLSKHWRQFASKVRIYRWGTNLDDNDNGEGQVIFCGLPRPSFVSHQLETKVLKVQDQGLENLANEIEIASFSRAFINLNADVYEFREQDSDAPPMNRLKIKLPSEPLAKLISKQKVLILNNTESLNELFSKMLEPIIQEHEMLLESKLLDDINTKLLEAPIILDFGAAINHIYSPHLEDPACVVARVKESIHYEAAPDKAVNLIFLVISPVGQNEKHLKLLASIAKLLNDLKHREKIMSAEDVDEIVATVHDFSTLEEN